MENVLSLLISCLPLPRRLVPVVIFIGLVLLDPLWNAEEDLLQLDARGFRTPCLGLLLALPVCQPLNLFYMMCWLMVFLSLCSLSWLVAWLWRGLDLCVVLLSVVFLHVVSNRLRI